MDAFLSISSTRKNYTLRQMQKTVVKSPFLKKSLCPCTSGLAYEKCCYSYHLGTAPPTALALMRSRYSAYALQLSEYIIKTTHPLNPHYKERGDQWKQGIRDFYKGTLFEKLEILDFEPGEEESFVTFKAHLKQAGEDATFTERSCFWKVNGRWLYLSGEIILK